MRGFFTGKTDQLIIKGKTDILIDGCMDGWTVGGREEGGRKRGRGEWKKEGGTQEKYIKIVSKYGEREREMEF